jgi:hypothetical protein
MFPSESKRVVVPIPILEASRRFDGQILDNIQYAGDASIHIVIEIPIRQSRGNKPRVYRRNRNIRTLLFKLVRQSDGLLIKSAFRHAITQKSAAVIYRC